MTALSHRARLTRRYWYALVLTGYLTGIAAAFIIGSIVYGSWFSLATGLTIGIGARYAASAAFRRYLRIQELLP